MREQDLPRDCVILERDAFDDLLDAVRAHGYSVVGPTVRDGAIVYGEIDSSADLPAGWTDVQEAGTYRLEQRQDETLFGFTVGPQSWKRYLFPPVMQLWKAQRAGDGFEPIADEHPVPRLAFLGVRSCELHAIAVQDRVFQEGPYVDPVYAQQRANLFIIAVNCSHAGGTCFCVSMQTGPRAEKGFDLALTEVLEDSRHYFVVEIGSELGAEVIDRVPRRDALDAERRTAERIVEATAAQMGREMPAEGLKELLYRNLEHPRWDDVASRCLSCTNCTMVCPTCFCSSVEDVTDLAGETAERVRRWDSCFNVDFSYIHGGSVRPTPRSRYRQWMTHKLATWHDQFGTSGCVGCGRCITWCPVGIDITEEVRAIRATDSVIPHDEETTDATANS